MASPVNSISDVEQVCSFTRGPGMTSPVVVASDGCGKAAKITVEAARVTVQ